MLSPLISPTPLTRSPVKVRTPASLASSPPSSLGSKLYIPDSHPILSQEGVRQGDPLGPVFFALGIYGAIVDWTARHPSVWFSWYLDDGIL